MTKRVSSSSASRTRLADVAAAADVSIATASRALSRAGRVSPSAEAAVFAAAERLDYRPDPIARAMRSSRTGLIGIVVPGVANPFFAEMVEALATLLQEQTLEMLLADSRGRVDEELRLVQMLLDRKIDGLIVIPVHEHESVEMLRLATQLRPVVQIDRFTKGNMADYVGVDNTAGIRAILAHVVDVGARRVVFVSDGGLSSTGGRRLKAFRSEVRKIPTLHVEPPILGEFSVDFGREAVRRLFDHTDDVDTIICSADIIALGVVQELHRAGLRVPADARVTGFDGILFGELCDPPITTVRQPMEAIAAEAISLMSDRLGGAATPPRRRHLRPILDVRRSSVNL